LSEIALLADPLSVIEGLTLELASLERQFSDRKIPKEQYDASSIQLRIRISNFESIAYVRARTNPALAERLRARSYLDSTVQQVCYHFISGSKEPLGPTFEADRIPRYFIEPERGVKLSVERALLQRLVYIGISGHVTLRKNLRVPQMWYPDQCLRPSEMYTMLIN